MAYSISGGAIALAFAQQQRLVNPSSRTKLFLLGTVFGSSPSGIVLTSLLARREAEAAPPQAVTPTFPMPSEVGEKLDQAKRDLEEKKLAVIINFESNNKVGKDIVIRTSPVKDELVSENDTVILVVSSGPPD
jgi:PASTA domain